MAKLAKNELRLIVRNGGIKDYQKICQEKSYEALLLNSAS